MELIAHSPLRTVGVFVGLRGFILKTLIRPSIAAVLGLGLVILSLAYLGFMGQGGEDQAHAAPQAQAANQPPFWRYLDTAGDGSGSKVATGTYTSTLFFIEPPAGAVYDIQRLIVTVEDSEVISSDTYGAATLAGNGLAIRRVSGSSIITFTDGISVMANVDWRRFCEVSQTNYAGTGNQLQAICEFGGAAVRLNGDRDERLEVLLGDDFSELDGHYFVAEGFQE